jgi:hypothetical protein
MFGIGGGAFGAGGVPKALEAVHVVGFLAVISAVLVAAARLIVGVIKGRRAPVYVTRRTNEETTDDWALDDLLLFGLIGGVIVFVALSNTDAFEFDRYMTSAVIFGSVLAGRLVGRITARVDSAIALRGGAVIGIAVVAAFSAGTALEVTSTSTPVGGYTAVTTFLEAKHLDNGIGDYLDASIITVATDGNVTVRPVSGDPEERIVRYQRQSSSSWYAGQSFEFLVYDSGIPGSFNSVTASLTFGAPKRTYSIGSYKVLVWAHPISVSVNGYDPG